MVHTLELQNNQIQQVVELICKTLPTRNIVLLYGDLGVGKTTLVKVICKYLGIQDNASSPSFGLVNEYGSGANKLYHIDLYRIRSVEEFWDIGGVELLESNAPCFIEWPELVQDYIDVHRKIEVYIAYAADENKRRYSIYM
ncbi:MAG: tRNA (adenosine(37)-N6)-threonylcarbamoyltransferase complex ATPase subunit type 1 TsaE [Bacteroidia bacterium]|nr:tRNA (adenosine(37)-N6)-threonylcarbamoyltransferase complex ATPase subunit type 1 TsaE [Bacteroidia bacterium]